MISTGELACVYASLILLDDDVPITAEKISTILKAANVTVESYWPGLFAKVSVGLDLKSIVSAIGSGVGSGAAVAAPAGGGKPEAATKASEEPKKEEKKEESEEESDEDMGFGLFD